EDAIIVKSAREKYAAELGPHKELIDAAPSEAVKQGMLLKLGKVEASTDASVLDHIHGKIAEQATTAKDVDFWDREVSSISSRLNPIAREVEALDLQKDAGAPIDESRHSAMIAQHEDLIKRLTDAEKRRDIARAIKESLSPSVTVDENVVPEKAPIADAAKFISENDFMSDITALQTNRDAASVKAFSDKYGRKAYGYVLDKINKKTNIDKYDFIDAVAQKYNADTSVTATAGITPEKHAENKKAVDFLGDKPATANVIETAKMLGIEPVAGINKAGKEYTYSKKVLLDKIKTQMSTNEAALAKAPTKAAPVIEPEQKTVPEQKAVPASAVEVVAKPVKTSDFAWMKKADLIALASSAGIDTKGMKGAAIGRALAAKGISAVKPAVAEKLAKATIDAAAHEAATSPRNDLAQPTQAQIEAGNYKKGAIKLYGLDISVENPKGSKRSGTSSSGKKWSVNIKDHYGYIKGTVGKDKDHIDTFIGPNPASQQVHVINQIDPTTGKFDEHKVMLSYNSAADAKKAYLANYEKGWKGHGSMVSMPMDQFKEWLKTGNTKAEIKAKPAEIKPAIPKATVVEVSEAQKAIENRLEMAKTNLKKAKTSTEIAAAQKIVDHHTSVLAKLKGEKVKPVAPVAPEAAPKPVPKYAKVSDEDIAAADKLDHIKSDAKEVARLAEVFGITTEDKKGKALLQSQVVKEIKSKATLTEIRQHEEDLEARAKEKVEVPEVSKRTLDRQRKAIGLREDLTAAQAGVLLRLVDNVPLGNTRAATLNALEKKELIRKDPSGKWVLTEMITGKPEVPLTEAERDIALNSMAKYIQPGIPMTHTLKPEVEDTIRRMLGTSKVPTVFKVWQSQQDMPEKLRDYYGGIRIQGAAYKGQIHLIANEITDVQAAIGTIIHEGAHHLLRTDSVWNTKWRDTMDHLFNPGTLTGADLELFDKAFDHLNAAHEQIPMGADEMREEALTYYLEEVAKLPEEQQKKYNIFQRIIKMVKAWVFRNFAGISAKRLGLTAQDIVSMIREDLRTAKAQPYTYKVEGAEALASFSLSSREYKNRPALYTISHGENSFLDYEYPEKGTVTVRDVFVDKPDRRQGIAEKMMRRVMAEHPNDRIVLGAVSPEMDKLAEKLGFSLISPKHFFMPDGLVPDAVNSKTMNTWEYTPDEKPRASTVQASSRLETEIIGKEPNRTSTAEQWIASLDKRLQPGTTKMPIVIQEELFWSGLREWLENKKGEQVSKQDILDFLDEEGLKSVVDIKVTSSGINTTAGISASRGLSEDSLINLYNAGQLSPGQENMAYETAEVLIKYPNSSILSWINDNAEAIDPGVMKVFDIAFNALSITDLQRDLLNDSLHAAMSDSSGMHTDRQNFIEAFKDYLSDTDELNEYAEKYETDEAFRNALADAAVPYMKYIEDQRIVFVYAGLDPNMKNVSWSGYSIIPQGKAKEIFNIEISIPEHNKDLKLFTSAHFKETPNQIAWARCVVLPTGELFVNEIQSDLHNKGNKYGYYTDEKQHAQDLKALEDNMREYKKEVVKQALSYLERPIGNEQKIEYAITDKSSDKHVFDSLQGLKDGRSPLFTIRQIKEIMASSALQSYKDAETVYKSTKDAIPALPFKDNYITVTFKEVIKEAVKRGITKIVWPASPNQVAKIEHWGDGIGTEIDYADGKWSIHGASVGGSIKQLTEVLTNSVKKNILQYGGAVGTAKLSGIEVESPYDSDPAHTWSVMPVKNGFMLQDAFSAPDEVAYNTWLQEDQDPGVINAPYTGPYLTQLSTIPHVFKTEAEAKTALSQLEKTGTADFLSTYNSYEIDDKMRELASTGDLPLASVKTAYEENIERSKLSEQAQALKDSFKDRPASEEEARKDYESAQTSASD
ncbi:MAG: hypothetical protein M0R68_13050, partial [Bacteroidetes bacterium]|nr:hypothetical protein [Bacteroidota bacterium]